ncbi:MAG: hypothetical protein ACKVS8_11265 [Phycisphaerales bacterium]
MHSFVVVGGANSETIIPLQHPLSSGAKHSADRQVETVGGGGLNQAVRLRMVGHTVFPVLPIGLGPGGVACSAALDVEMPDMGPPNHTYDADTSHATILLSHEERTIITVDSGVGIKFADEVASRVEKAARDAADQPAQRAGRPFAILVGHIRGEKSLEATKACFAKCSGGSVLRFFFPGSSQYKRCFHQWDDLWDQIHYVQFELSEARDFVFRSRECEKCRACIKNRQETRLARDAAYRNDWKANAERQQAIHMDATSEQPSLEAILSFFQMANTTAVVTANRWGAAAVLRNESKLFLVPPYRIPGVKDPTGAGDAFGAGAASKAMEFSTPTPVGRAPGAFTKENFQAVLNSGSLWGRIACDEYGGCSHCPTSAEIGHQETSWPQYRLPGHAGPFSVEESAWALELMDGSVR